jgi:hypothetical protein
VLGANITAAEAKTAPSHDVFVESSTTNFALTVKGPRVSGNGRLEFELAAPRAGSYTLVCFIDGKLWKPSNFTAPGNYELSTRGMAPGRYRLTFQLIDPQGQVGSQTRTIQVK